MLITRSNADALLDAGRIEIAMATGRWQSVRRNGATQTWKRDAARLRIPLKHGFRSTLAITEVDFRNGPAGDALNPAHFRVMEA